MTSFFHSYDLRGIYPDEIGLDEAEKVGKAYGTHTEAEEVLIGRDGRTNGSEVAEAFMDGVCSTGTDVAYMGMAPTPLIYFGQVRNGFGSAAVVTASHNPSEYTGFKFNRPEGVAMSRQGGMRDIQDIYESGDFEAGSGSVREIEVLDDYVREVSELAGNLDLDVLIDCGNGVTGLMTRRLFEELGCNVRILNEEIDGSFPSHLPDPTNTEAQQTVEKAMDGEDLGIIFDGDGDRAGFVLPEHGYIQEDEVITLLSEQALDHGKGEVIHDLRTSKIVAEKVEEYGGEPVESRVGHTFISEEIHARDDAVFAGELSGHFYFPVYGFPWDDGLLAGALMAKIADTQDLVKRLEGFPDYPVSPEINFECSHERKDDIMEAISQEFSDHDTSTMDGVKISFDSGWALVRPSSTEPKIRLRCEADTDKALQKIRSQMESELQQILG
jgi:Phosphomannomutase